MLVVGGLYGNLAALATIEAMAEAESRCGAAVTVVFNGDFNFFNAHESDFRELNRRVLLREPGAVTFLATAGNIELAISGGAAGAAGCGCDYPAYVSPEVVRRSDRIVELLGAIAGASGRADAEAAELLRAMAALPLYETLEVGGRRVGVIHGDPEMLSGWSFGVELMSPPGSRLLPPLPCSLAPLLPCSLAPLLPCFIPFLFFCSLSLNLSLSAPSPSTSTSPSPSPSPLPAPSPDLPPPPSLFPQHAYRSRQTTPVVFYVSFFPQQTSHCVRRWGVPIPNRRPSPSSADGSPRRVCGVWWCVCVCGVVHVCVCARARARVCVCACVV